MIPIGETRNYSDIAKELEGYSYARAVANACKCNEIAFIIPCHRVTGKNEVGGYKWGRGVKKRLLDWERLGGQAELFINFYSLGG